MPSGPGVISDEQVARVSAHVGRRARTFLLTSQQSAADVIAQHRAAGTSTLQLVDAMEPTAYAALRDALPGVDLVQVIHVTGDASVDEALAVAPHVDALLLDSGNPALAVKELGGTGRAHDWSVSARIVEAVRVPVYLAGGLRAHNVAEAIAMVRPFGLDLCTGVRTDGVLDDEKLEQFMAAVRGDPFKGSESLNAGRFKGSESLNAAPIKDSDPLKGDPATGGSGTARLVAALLDRTLPKAEWTHHAHLRAGLWMVRTYGAEAAVARLRVAIRNYNVAVGGENTDSAGYHETLTRAYVHWIAHFLASDDSGATDLDVAGDALIARYGDRELPYHYWSRERLMSVEARRAWIPPDLAPLP
jgi:phosphoribosylanthranilate isomerase